MTVQDYLMQQVPHKAKAEMAFKQGDYQQAAESIATFAEGCASVSEYFDTEKDHKAFQVQVIGYNNSSLMMNKILEETAQRITNPTSGNPYHEGRNLRDDEEVPEIVAELAFETGLLASNYGEVLYEREPSASTAMGFLMSMSQWANTGLYYNEFSESEVELFDILFKRSEHIANLLSERLSDDANAIQVLKRYYTLVGLFCMHYDKFSTNSDYSWMQIGSHFLSLAQDM